MRRIYRETGYIADPHTSVGLAAAAKAAGNADAPMIVLATAHPAKFPDAVERATGRAPAIPDRLRRVLSGREQFTPLDADTGAIRAFIKARGAHPRQRCSSMTIEMTTLANGLSVVTCNMPHLETASLGVWVNTGARSELPHEHGLAHLLEHMAFKGTKTRSALQIAEEIEAVGGGVNAMTSFETTDYFARVLREHVPLALDILADILQNPVFDAEDLEREKEVILQEIASVQDSPDDLVFELAQEAAFPDQPLGRLDSRHAGQRARPHPRGSRRLSRRRLYRAAHGAGRGRRRRSRRHRRRGAKSCFPPFRAARAAPSRPPVSSAATAA